jgi:Peptidase inhibitor family I36
MNARSHPLSRRNRLRLAAILVLAPVLGLIVSTLPSAPAAMAATCPFDYLCTWQNASYSGTQWNFTYSSHIPTATWVYVGSAPNDKISSYRNGLNQANAYIAKNCPADSQWTWIPISNSNSNLSGSKWQNGTSINDSISAIALGAFGTSKVSDPSPGSRTNGGC